MKVPGWPAGSNMDHEIIVAVVDMPVDFTNPDLDDISYTFSTEQQALLGCDDHGFNALWESKNGKLDYDGAGSHGTHVAGIIGAEWDGRGISGAGSNVKIVSVQNSKGGGHLLVIADYDPLTKEYLILDSAGNYEGWSHSFSSWQKLSGNCLQSNPDVSFTSFRVLGPTRLQGLSPVYTY